MPRDERMTVRKRAQLSCDRCRQGKRKCDRRLPCGRCQSDRAECSFTGVQDRLARGTGQANRVVGLVNSDRGTLDVIESAERASKRIPSTDVFESGDEVEIIDRHLNVPRFLHRIFEIYVREIDWLSDLLVDTHIDVSIRTSSLATYGHLDQATRDAFRPLAIVVTALTAQMCPTEVEAVLMDLHRKEQSVEIIISSQTLAKTAYNGAVKVMDSMQRDVEVRRWSAEHFAARLLIRLYEKNSGTEYPIHQTVLLDAQRLQLAGFQHDRSAQGFETTTEHIHDRLLAYRTFWAFFEKDRVASWYSGTGYTYHPRHCRICLRSSVPMHTTMTDLCGESTASVCECASETLPHLTLYGAIQAKTGAILGNFYDKTEGYQARAFRWPEDAERLTMDLDKEIMTLSLFITYQNDQNPSLFKRSQVALLRMRLAHMRSDIARYMCDKFADILRKRGETDQATILWMLERHRSEANIAMIQEGATTTAEMTRYAISWIPFTKFLANRVHDLINFLSPWLSRANGQQGSLPMSQIQKPAYEHLIKCLRFVFIGRNVVVLLVRRNELSEAKKIGRQLCEAVSSLLEKTGIFSSTGRFGPLSLPMMKEPTRTIDEQLYFNTIRSAMPMHIDTSPDVQEMQTVSTSFSDNVLTPFDEDTQGGEKNSLDLQSLLDSDLHTEVDKLFMEFPSLENFLRYPHTNPP